MVLLVFKPVCLLFLVIMPAKAAIQGHKQGPAPLVPASTKEEIVSIYPQAAD